METKSEMQEVVRELKELREQVRVLREQAAGFEERYHQSFAEFKQAWHSDKVADKYSFHVERDYWEWEAAVEDAKKYQQLLDEWI
jgi:hypothetical protein